MICSLTNFPSGFSSLSFHEDDPKSMMASTTHLNGTVPIYSTKTICRLSKFPSDSRFLCLPREGPLAVHGPDHTPKRTVPIYFARPLAPHLNTALPSAGGSKVSWCGYSGSDQPWVKGSTQARSRQPTRGDTSISQRLCRVVPRLDHSQPMRHSLNREQLSLLPSNSSGTPHSAGVHVPREKLSPGSRVAAPTTIHRRVHVDPVVQVISGPLLVEHSNPTVDHDH